MPHETISLNNFIVNVGLSNNLLILMEEKNITTIHSNFMQYVSRFILNWGVGVH